MKTKIVVFKKDFQEPVLLSDSLPDIAKTVFTQGVFRVEPLKDWAGVNFYFPTVKNIEYTFKLKVDPKTSTVDNKFKITITDDGDPTVYNTTVVDVTQVKEYEIKQKFSGHNAWFKFYYEETGVDNCSSWQHVFDIVSIEVYVEDLTKDFSTVDQDNAPLILQNLQVNAEEICMSLVTINLSNSTEEAIYLAKLDKLKQIKLIYDAIANYNFTSNPLTLQYQTLTLDI